MEDFRTCMAWLTVVCIGFMFYVLATVGALEEILVEREGKIEHLLLRVEGLELAVYDDAEREEILDKCYDNRKQIERRKSEKR